MKIYQVTDASTGKGVRVEGSNMRIAINRYLDRQTKLASTKAKTILLNYVVTDLGSARQVSRWEWREHPAEEGSYAHDNCGWNRAETRYILSSDTVPDGFSVGHGEQWYLVSSAHRKAWGNRAHPLGLDPEARPVASPAAQEV